MALIPTGRAHRRLTMWAAVAAAVCGPVVLAGCSPGPTGTEGATTTVPAGSTTAPPKISTTTPAPTTTPTTTPASTTTPSTTPPGPPTTTTPTTTPTTTTMPAPTLSLGSSGPSVLALQRRLATLHYWVGAPNGVFGDSTQQAVYALQKAAGIARDGAVGPQTEQALAAGVEPHPRPTSGYAVEVDLSDDLLMLVTRGALLWTLNTSTGGGYIYTGGAIADTPVGTFTIYREVDGLVTDSLGQLWRPKYFDGGFALHGDASVPPYPVSHGCVRVSNEAIDWIWSTNLAPIGTSVWIFT